MKEEQKKNNNIGMKVLSVIIAILIWLLVANTNDPVITKRFTNVEVKIENENALTDNGYAYEVIDGSETSFTIKGKKSIVNGMTETDFNVVADFSKLSLTDAVPIDVTAAKYEDQLEITLGNTNTMKIRKDEITSVSLPVNVSLVGSAAEGYYVGTSSATPNLIRVDGPENLLSEAKEIRVEVDIEDINTDITSSAKPYLYDNSGERIESNQIQMEVNSVIVSIGLWKTKKVKVKLDYEGDAADGYMVTSFDYEPKTVTVAASEDVYDELKTLDLNAVDLDGVSENYEHDIAIDSSNFPDGVILADTVTSIKVNAKVEQVIDRKITFSKNDLKIKNNPGYKISFENSNKYSLSIYGASTAVNDAKVDDFSPWIDLEGLDPGEHEVSIHVKDSDDDHISVDETSRIIITLEE